MTLGDGCRTVNEVELAARLRAALEDSGRSAWELSRRANVKLRLVEEMLQGSGRAPIRAIVRVAEALELEVLLAPIQAPQRVLGQVHTLVDNALKPLRGE